MTSAQMALVRDMVRCGAIRRGRFVLASGQESDHYFDVKRLLLDPKGSHLAACMTSAYLGAESDSPPAAVGGIGVGGILYTGAVIGRLGKAVRGFAVRDAAKAHGVAGRIVGLDGYAGPVTLLEDVVTTGGSVIAAADVLAAAGLLVTDVVAVVDRSANNDVVGNNPFADRGWRFRALVTAAEALRHAAAVENVGSNSV